MTASQIAYTFLWVMAAVFSMAVLYILVIAIVAAVVLVIFYPCRLLYETIERIFEM